MTRAQILHSVSLANEAMAAGDCASAMQSITAATTGMYGYRGRDRNALQRRVNIAYASVTQACSGDDGLLPPSGTERQFFDGALGFALPARERIMPAVGWGFAVLGLAIGIGTLYKQWK